MFVFCRRFFSLPTLVWLGCRFLSDASVWWLFKVILIVPLLCMDAVERISPDMRWTRPTLLVDL